MDQKKKLDDEKQMGFIEHLEELRRRLIASLITIFIASCVVYVFVEQIIELSVKSSGMELVFLAPQEVFLTYIITAIFCGIFLASPIVLFQIWRFVAAGLKKEEKRYILWYAPCSFLLFVGGALFAYTIVLPVTMKFFLGFSNDFLTPMISISKYISFSGSFLLAFGLVFQMPVVILLLTNMGIVNSKFLRAQRKYALLMTFIVGAIMTPSPDVFTQLLMAVPLLALFEITIWLSLFVDYRKKRSVEGIPTIS